MAAWRHRRSPPRPPHRPPHRRALGTTPGDPTVEDQLAAANAQIDPAEQEQNHRLDDLLTAFDDMYDGMEAERQLLLEMRKPIPEERKDAEAYFNRLQSLAIVSDPSRLGQPASRLLETAPILSTGATAPTRRRPSRTTRSCRAAPQASARTSTTSRRRSC